MPVTVLLAAFLSAAPVSQDTGYEDRLVAWGLGLHGRELEPAPEGKRLEEVLVASEDVFAPSDPYPLFLNLIHVRTRELNVDELQKTAQTKRDAASFETLGMAYLGAWRVKDAQLVLGRALEVEPQRASAHSALGYALLLDGDAPGAFNEYSLALKADPTFLKARANLGALRCRFAEKDGAHRELSMLQGATVSGADVDPEWSTCH
jgi:tetratricopeptide (TPR) repeat protein